MSRVSAISVFVPMLRVSGTVLVAEFLVSGRGGPGGGGGPPPPGPPDIVLVPISRDEPGGGGRGNSFGCIGSP